MAWIADKGLLHEGHPAPVVAGLAHPGPEVPEQLGVIRVERHRPLADLQRLHWLLREEECDHQRLQPADVLRIQAVGEAGSLDRALRCPRRTGSWVEAEAILVEAEHREHRPCGGVAWIAGDRPFKARPDGGVAGG